MNNNNSNMNDNSNFSNMDKCNAIIDAIDNLERKVILLSYEFEEIRRIVRSLEVQDFDAFHNQYRNETSRVINDTELLSNMLDNLNVDDDSTTDSSEYSDDACVFDWHLHHPDCEDSGKYLSNIRCCAGRFSDFYNYLPPSRAQPQGGNYELAFSSNEDSRIKAEDISLVKDYVDELISDLEVLTLTKRERRALKKKLRGLKLDARCDSPEPQIFESIVNRLSDATTVPRSLDDLASSADDIAGLLGEHSGPAIDAIRSLAAAIGDVAGEAQKFGASDYTIKAQHSLGPITPLLDIFSKSKLLFLIFSVLAVKIIGWKKYFLCASVIALVFSKLDFKKLLESVIDFFSSTGIECQLNDGEHFKNILLAVWHYCLPDSDLAPEFRTYVEDFMAASVKKKKLIDFAFPFLQDFLRWVTSKLNSSYSWMVIFEPYPEALSLINLVDKLCVDFDCNSSSLNDAATQAVSLRRRIEVELKRHAGDAKFTTMRASLIEARNKCDRLENSCRSYGAGRDVTRVPPATCLIIGKPGMGKSYVLDQISIAVLVYKNKKSDAKSISDVLKNMSQYVFSKNFADKYWEGYCNQPIVYMDEVGQSRDTAGSSLSENEYVTFIEMVNDKPSSLNMAEISNKGNTYFDSELVLGTSNLRKFNIESINQPEAYDRRWKRKYECFVIPECSVKSDNGKSVVFNRLKAEEYYRNLVLPDGSRYTEEEVQDKIASSDFLRFKRVESLLTGDVSSDDSIGIQDLIKLILSDIHDRDQSVTDKMKHRSRLGRKWMEQLDVQGIEVQHEDCDCPVCVPVTDCYIRRMWGYFRSKFPFLPFEIPDIIPQSGMEGATCYSKFDCASFSAFLANVPGVWNKFCNPIMLQCASFVSSNIVTLTSIVGIASALYWCFAPKGGERTRKSEAVAQISAHCYSLCDKVLRRNTIRFLKKLDGELHHVGFGLGLVGRMIVVPRHYLVAWRTALAKGKELDLYISRIGEGPDGTIHSLDIIKLLDGPVFYPNEDVDLAFIYLKDNILPWFPDITRYFTAMDSDVCKGLFPDIGDDLDLTNCFADIVVRKVGNPDGETYYTMGADCFTNKNSFDYNYPSEVGDCGLPVFRNRKGDMGKTILGIHTAGKGGGTFGCGVPIDSRDLERAKGFFLNNGFLTEVQMACSDHSLLIAEDDSFDSLEPVPYNAVPRKLALGRSKPSAMPFVSSIIKSPIHGDVGFEPKTKPAKLRTFDFEGVTIDPIALSTGKYSRDSLFPVGLMNQCIDDYSDVVLNMEGSIVEPICDRRVLTYQEAVAGIPGVPGLDGIPRKTSAGYPWCIMIPKGTRGKQCFWGAEGDYEFGNDCDLELQSRVNKIIEYAVKGTRLPHVFLDFPKDERRPIDKVNAGKTRKISGCPVDLTIAVRMYFGAFAQYYMANRIFNGSAVGIDMYSEEVGRLVSYLSRSETGCRPRVIAGDFGNFDGSLPYSLISSFCKIVNDYYGSDARDNRIRETLIQEFANSRHILPDGVVYEWVGSNASGNPLTTILNSWCNNVMVRAAICKIYSKENEARSFLKSVRGCWNMIAYGDDNLISIGSKKLSLVTQQALTTSLGEIGFEYTDEYKSDKIVENRSIYEVSFLKRSFARNCVANPNKFVAPLALDTILESIQWTKKKDEEAFYVSNKDNVCKMIKELSLHPRSTFDEHCPKILRACRENLGFIPYPNTYDECQRDILSSGICWE